MLVGAMYKINTIPGVIRPCITATIPCINGKKSVLLDVGSNADCKVDVLYQFAELGSLYAEHILKIEQPRIGLLNIGEEESKGNLLTQAVYKLLQESDSINFIGNVEGRDIFTNKADVIVCDGFTGNVVLKEAEGFYNMVKARGIDDDYFNLFNFENYGGTPILGVKGNVVIGHGSSNETAVLNMILHAHQVAANKLSVKITKAFK
jgi:glycerol-3-phosphate acyltransferase PlsX